MFDQVVCKENGNKKQNKILLMLFQKHLELAHLSLIDHYFYKVQQKEISYMGD
jgi:hypothetical protein